jgi:glycosyltransferase involved in cell wall biosynthesis
MPVESGRGVLLSLVVPVYNEAESVGPLVEEIERVLPSIPGPCEVILVDDGSRDGSWDRIREAAAGRRWLRGVRFLGNQGQTAAIAAGIDAAAGELVAFMDADLQNDPADLPRLLEPVLSGRADGVCGWRSPRRDGALSRVVPSVIANALIAAALGLRLHDVGCTLKVFRRPFLEDAHLVGEMHRFIPAYALAQGARIEEVKVHHRERRFGRSKYGLTRIYKVLLDLVTVKMLSAYGSKPAYFFGKMGFTLLILATAAFALVAYRALVLGRTESTPMIFIMMLLYMASLACFMVGLLAEINIRILVAAGGRRPYKIVEEVGAAPADAGERRALKVVRQAGAAGPGAGEGI